MVPAERGPRRRGVDAHRVHRRPAEAACPGPRRGLTLLQVWRVRTEPRLQLHGVSLEGRQDLQEALELFVHIYVC